MNIFKAVDKELQLQNNQPSFFSPLLIIHVWLCCLIRDDCPSSSSLRETGPSPSARNLPFHKETVYSHWHNVSLCAPPNSDTKYRCLPVSSVSTSFSLFHILSINNFQCPWYFAFRRHMLVLWLLHYASLSQSEHRAFCNNSHKSATQLLRIVSA